MSERVTVAEPFVAAPQQRQADFMGMYIFLGTEIMLFGGLFAWCSAIALCIRPRWPRRRATCICGSPPPTPRCC